MVEKFGGLALIIIGLAQIYYEYRKYKIVKMKENKVTSTGLLTLWAGAILGVALMLGGSAFLSGVL